MVRVDKFHIFSTVLTITLTLIWIALWSYVMIVHTPICYCMIKPTEWYCEAPLAVFVGVCVLVDAMLELREVIRSCKSSKS